MWRVSERSSRAYKQHVGLRNRRDSGSVRVSAKTVAHQCWDQSATRSDKSLKRLITPIRPQTIGGAAARYLQVVCSPGVSHRTFKHALLSLETHESHSQPRLGGHRNNLYMQLRAPKSGLALYVDSRLNLERRASADVLKRSDSRAIPSGASIPRCATPNVKNYRLTTD